MTVWGIWTDDPKTHATRMLGKDGHLQQITRTYDEREVPPRIMLMHAWQEHLEMPELVAKVSESCARWKVSRLLIENKSVGMPVARELRRMYSGKNFGVQLEDPGSVDKMSRLYSVQHLFEEGLVYCPDKAWADEVISQCMRFPKAKHDDLCLVGDTMILMADGSEKRIDSIEVGDQVRTPNGTGTVSASAQTGVKPIWKLVHTNGVLRGTANHPVMCDGEYKPLSSCDVNGKLVTPYQHEGVTSWHLENKKTQELKQLSSMGSDIIDTQNQKTKRTNGILEGLGTYCTEMFGNFITVLSQRAIKFITSIAIRPIMTLPIWTACQEKFTGKSIMMNMSLGEKKMHHYSISNVYSHWLKNGTEVMKVANGIGKTPLQASDLRMHQNRIAKAIMWAYANGAALILKLKAPEKLCVQADALKRNQNTSEVLSVNAMNIMLPVYNLTIDGEHCYYANRILTHNCDTVSMAMRYLRRSGFILRTDEVSQDYEDSRYHTGREPAPLYGV
jgi:predicted phage terminase large subunit-like protein